jgi:hypothetical protein
MSPIRKAILVAFVGASLWAFSLYISVELGLAPKQPWEFLTETRAAVSAEESKWPDVPRSDFAVKMLLATYDGENKRAKGLILGATLQKEILILTIAGAAWVLAPLVKPRA